MKNKAWNDYENAGAVQLYLAMIDAARAGRPYNKAAMIRIAQSSGENVGIPNGYHGALKDRSKQSIEFKLMNCSAAHADLIPGAVTMDGYGYRAMPNYQAALKAELAEALTMDGELDDGDELGLAEFDRVQSS